MVVGVEGDFGWASKTTTLSGALSHDRQLQQRPCASLRHQDHLGRQARGRIGYLITPSVLAYATGGAAWLHVNRRRPAAPLASCRRNPTFGPSVISHSTTKLGWTAGGGIEAMLWSNWIGRVEYRMPASGSITNADTRRSLITVQTATYDLRNKTHTATFGVAYKFGESNAAYAAFAAARGTPPALAAPSSWTGLYVGAGVGVRSTETAVSVTGRTIGAFDALAFTCATTDGCVTRASLNDSAFRAAPMSAQLAGGAAMGRRRRGDWGWARKTTTLAGMYYPVNGIFGPISGNAANTFSVEATWDASARARVGLLVNPSILAYVTGGAAWLHVESTSRCNTANNANCGGGGVGSLRAPAVITDSTTRLGWTVGGGLEAMLWSNWILRGEYRYADFGTITNIDTRIGLGGAEVVTYDLRVKSHLATFGLAYKFGGRSSPLTIAQAFRRDSSWCKMSSF